MKIMTEKYRPKSLDNVIGQTDVVKLLKRYVKEQHMTHLLFSGEPGTGKTSCAMALIKDLYGEDYKFNVLTINASKETGIDNIRTKVNHFAMTKMSGDYPFKIIFLDECDHLSEPSQAALRRVMEQYSEHTRFILSCNYLYKIIKPIQDRCSLYRFKELDFDELHEALKNVAQTENIEISDDSLRTIAVSSRGSLRRALTTLEDVTIGADKGVDDGLVKRVVGQVMTDTQTLELIKMVKEQDYFKLQDEMYRLRSMGVPPEEIIEDIMYGYERTDTDIKTKMLVTAKCADYDYRICMGANPQVQLMAFFRDLMKLESG